ncbi:ethanolamine ammonia-lyase reactivating factor EutA [Rhodoferax sp.]|uniref:ethanolamine ammonia-lyase reactivating factor EutA n=1 Tax=Rhodoferax sp. TaxID=50421 RepID=UPI00272649AC|nr:ethanolamine ammonia-lyase reactivating factor EutA [Rhodoferax sp.]MDO8320187.1 ethanolamine ammonia-lyase reactivating factor EutA [Rhodoferax sp.]
MNTRCMRSIGIDLGTTTSQVIFSELEIVNTAGPTSVPHYEFSRRDILYVSPVIFTPFDADGNVDVRALDIFIRKQYELAGLTVQDVESGAVIITGETSKARNARETVMSLAAGLGDFVVATAGPHLESVIAGRGSGAGAYSEKNAARVLNIDVGGGTSNYVVFEGGRVLDTACLNVGGHLLQTDAGGRVSTVHAPAAIIVRDLLGEDRAASQLSTQDLQKVAERMAALIIEVMQARPSKLAQQLLMTEPLREAYRFDAVFISGGVGECMVRPSAESPYRFGDIGPLLAQALGRQLAESGFPVREPAQTLRATVIGAGAHTLTLSGSTVWNKYQGAPLRNVPVLHSRMRWREFRPGALSVAWQDAVKGHDLDAMGDVYALALPDDIPATCQTVWQAALELQSFSRTQPGSTHPLVAVTSQDIGKALGMELFRLVPGRELLIIDEVFTRAGDYLDIGKSYFNGGTIPVTVKSLAFPH